MDLISDEKIPRSHKNFRSFLSPEEHESLSRQSGAITSAPLHIRLHFSIYLG
jgi:hypothetical protein